MVDGPQYSSNGFRPAQRSRGAISSIVLLSDVFLPCDVSLMGTSFKRQNYKLLMAWNVNIITSTKIAFEADTNLRLLQRPSSPASSEPRTSLSSRNSAEWRAMTDNSTQNQGLVGVYSPCPPGAVVPSCCGAASSLAWPWETNKQRPGRGTRGRSMNVSISRHGRRKQQCIEVLCMQSTILLMCKQAYTE